MTPRSAEFADEARERLAAARDSFAAGHLGVAASIAYSAMLYAARAALSERDLHAKTHGGTWSLFSEAFVKDGPIDKDLAAKARDAEVVRYQADYDAAHISRAERTTPDVGRGAQSRSAVEGTRSACPERS